jgi:hypothetical protein
VTDIQIKTLPRPRRFIDALDAYIEAVILPKYIVNDHYVNAATLRSMRDDIVAALGKLIHKASFPTSVDMVEWLGTEHFLSIEINGVELRDTPGVFDAFKSEGHLRAPIEDIRRFRDIFRETSIADALDKEIARRG